MSCVSACPGQCARASVGRRTHSRRTLARHLTPAQRAARAYMATSHVRVAGWLKVIGGGRRLVQVWFK
eukprot:1046894-Pyramimonas_sp.AAC.1